MTSSTKLILDDNSFARLETFVTNVEEKLAAMKGFYEKFYELISLVSQTHGTIFQELTTMKVLLHQSKVAAQAQQEPKPLASPSKWETKTDDESLFTLTSKFQSKSVTNLNPIDYSRDNSPTDRQHDQNSLYSSSSLSQDFSSPNSLNNDQRPTSSPTKRSSNLKKSNQPTSTRVKSPKSVSFVLDQKRDLPSSTVDEQRTHLEFIQSLPNRETNAELTPTNISPISRASSDLLPDLFQQHHHEVTNKPNIGYQMGNALTNVRIHEIEPVNGEYLCLLNISNTVDYDLTGHFLQQNMACVPICRFRFPVNTIIRAGQTITVWCGALKNIEAQPPEVFVWKEQRQWEIGPECVTILAKPTGQAIAWTRSSQRIPVDPASNDLLSSHAKTHPGTPDMTSVSANSLKSASRLSTANFIGHSKGLVTHSSSNSDYRAVLQQKTGISQLLNRPKSSPYASHAGCKQDLICMDILRTKTTRGDPPSTVKI